MCRRRGWCWCGKSALPCGATGAYVTHRLFRRGQRPRSADRDDEQGSGRVAQSDVHGGASGVRCLTRLGGSCLFAGSSTPGFRILHRADLMKVRNDSLGLSVLRLVPTRVGTPSTAGTVTGIVCVGSNSCFCRALILSCQMLLLGSSNLPASIVASNSL